MSRILLFLFCVSLPFKTYSDGFNTEQFNNINEEILQQIKNVSQLSNRLHGTDKDTAGSLQDESNFILSELGHFEDLGNLYSEMVNTEDKAKVRILILQNKKRFSQQCHVNTVYTTNILSIIKNQDLLFEGEKLRISVQKACNFLYKWE